MRLDVVLPFHRVDTLLSDAVHSVLESRNVRMRLILINDSDRTLTLNDLKINLPLRNKILITTPGYRSGYGVSLYRAKSYIESDYVGLMNSDDLIDSSRFFKQLELLKSGDYDLSITKIERINEKSQRRASLFAVSEPSEYSPFLLILGAYGANASWTMKSDWFLGLEMDEEACLDWRIAMSYFRQSKIAYIPESLYFYRKHQAQVTRIPLSDLQLQRLFEKWLSFSLGFGVAFTSIDQFLSLATPWTLGRQVNPAEICYGIDAILDAMKDLPFEIQGDVRRILRRRMIFASAAIREMSPASIRCLSLAIAGLPSFLGDLVKG